MPRPTCKVAVVAGKRGAQIYPRGCKVRRRIDKKGRATRTNLAGKAKQTIVATEDEFDIYVAIKHSSGLSQPAPYTWDTGAQRTIIGYGTAKQCKLLDKDGKPIGPHGKSRVETAVGAVTRAFKFKNQELVVFYGGREYRITTDIHVVKHGMRLLGVPAIRSLRNEGLVVKFK